MFLRVCFSGRLIRDSRRCCAGTADLRRTSCWNVVWRYSCGLLGLSAPAALGRSRKDVFLPIERRSAKLGPCSVALTSASSTWSELQLLSSFDAGEVNERL